ncbi:LRR receptor-like serine/threonine-protein kinase SIK1 [Magnolia sinica]|uniref:LRR receptor-like serine/threonine-protein kinase SIK1 n=1 Tax=Magnolia sinica TaxID=86752 RepID=UPI002658272A|nr:LRR receptor-like serine/threonine-protein kinase SIK1 [Magnolia sinica]
MAADGTNRVVYCLNVGSSGWQHYSDQAIMVVTDRDLAQNRLTGDIPRLIYWNEVLQYLSLQGNRLTGKIPEVIGLMHALAILSN